LQDSIFFHPDALMPKLSIHSASNYSGNN